jgi:hypothetical protein
LKPLQARSWITGGSIAVAVGFAVAIYFSIADWKLNPGGIFHDDSGTRWGTVLETAVSWFLPVALVVFVLATAVLHLLPPRDSHE